MGYRVTADIRYLDGNLAGLEIPAGHCVNYMSREQAQRAAQRIEKTRAAGDFTRAAVTGNRYIFTSPAIVSAPDKSGIYR